MPGELRVLPTLVMAFDFRRDPLQFFHQCFDERGQSLLGHNVDGRVMKLLLLPANKRGQAASLDTS